MSAVLDKPNQQNQALARSNASGSMRASSVVPNQGEDYRTFVHRAHYALMPTIPDPEQRNRVVWNAWERVYGNPLRDQALQYFPPEQYRHVPDVCYFMEHQTVGRDGTPLNYGFNELADIMEEGNQRTDTNAYSAICSHHTGGMLKGPKHEPEAMGYAGPYSLGMVGRVNPKWAIFADEHHANQHLDTFAARRRRSVEVLRFADGRRSYFDPIATLGSDSPRLPLPVNRYEARQGDELIGVERYSVVSPVAVSASNTYIPGTENRRRDQYELDDCPPNQGQQSNSQSNSQGDAMNESGTGANGGMLTAEEIKAIAQMVLATPQLQWVTEQMEKAPQAPGNGSVLPSSQPTGEVSEDDLSLGGQASTGQPPTGLPPTGQHPQASPAGQPSPMSPSGSPASGHLSLGGHPGQPMAHGSQPNPNHKTATVGMLKQMSDQISTHQPNPNQPSPNPVRNPNSQHYSAKDGNMSTQNGQANGQAQTQVTVEQYSALVNENQALTEQYSALADQYSALNQAHTQLFAQHAELKASVTKIQQRAVDSERTQAIKDLYSQYPHFVVPEEEFQRCLYAQGSTMEETQFQAHMADLAKYAQRSSPVSQMIPGGSFDQPAHIDKYAAEVAAKTVERYTDEASKGIVRSYDAIEAEVRKEMGLAS